VNFKMDKTLGYMYSYEPTHSLANNSGKVYEHIYVMVEHIGRELKPDECIHHKDRNRSNNGIDNLQLMTKSEHMELHQREDNGCVKLSTTCPICGNVVNFTENVKKVFCSRICSSKARRKFEVGKEELKQMVWQMPMSKLSELLGVSDVTIAKRCKHYGIEKPPTGYWLRGCK
jgi:hypothetical protein